MNIAANTITQSEHRTFAKSVDYNRYIAEMPASTPEEFYLQNMTLDPINTLNCIFLRTIGIADLVQDQFKGNEFCGSPSNVINALWQVRGNLEMADDIVMKWGNKCNHCQKCDDKTRQSIYEKIRDNEPDTESFTMAAHFVMNLDGKIGQSARSMFKVASTNAQFKADLLALLEQEHEGGAV